MLRFARSMLAGAAILGAVAAGPVAEAATADGLRAILAFVPAAANPPRKGIVDYTDLAVAAALTGKRGFEAVAALVRRVSVPTQGQYSARAEDWPRKTGFALDDVEALAAAGDPPHSVHFYRLAPAVKLDALKKTWSERGYAETSAGGVALWTRGKPGQLDLANRDPDDPFGGTLGRASVLLPALPVIAESFVAASLLASAAARATGGLAARADVAALLNAVDRGSGQLLQAALVTEPAASMTARGGIAPYSALLFADIEHGSRAETLLVLAFRDCADAAAAEAAIKQRWREQADALRPLAPAWRSRAEGGVCVLTGAIAEARPAAARTLENPPYRTILHGLYARHLTALEIRAPR